MKPEEARGSQANRLTGFKYLKCLEGVALACIILDSVTGGCVSPGRVEGGGAAIGVGIGGESGPGGERAEAKAPQVAVDLAGAEEKRGGWQGGQRACPE